MPLDVSSVESAKARPPQTSPRKSHKRSCCLLLVLVPLLLLLGVVWAILATGFWHVPVLSRVAYKAPVPERVVSPGASVESEVWKSVSQSAGSVLSGGSLGEPLSFTLSESALTQSLQTGLRAEAAASPFSPDGAQVAVTPEGLRVFLPFKTEEGAPANALQATLVPRVVDGEVRIEATDVSVGSLPIPRVVVDELLERLVRPQITRLNNEIGNVGGVESFTFHQGSLEIQVTVSPEALRPSP